MDDALLDILIDKLQDVDSEVSDLVLAACGDPGDLEAHIAGGRPGSRRAMDDAATRVPAGAFLKSISVEGFRGVGPRATLDLPEGPGLTLVVGRNGSGKSSFAEGFEMLFTGSSRRWAGRAVVWRDGWRNLHHDGPVTLQTELLVEDGAPTVAVRSWDSDAGIENSTTWAQPNGKPKASLADLGWDTALVAYRPFLSYSELGSILDGKPSEFYDALAAILGLGDLAQAQESLRQARLNRERSVKEVRAQLTGLLPKLEAMADDRARRCFAALSAKPPDLSAAEAVIYETDDTAAESDMELLRRAAALETPSIADASDAAAALRSAAELLESIKGTEADRDRQVAGLLDTALRFHADHGDSDCPVCGGARLDDNWRAESEMQAAQLRERAGRADAAHSAMTVASRKAESLLKPPPTFLDQVQTVGLDTSHLVAAWAAWTTPAEDLAEHLETNIEPLADAVATLRANAVAEIEARESAWRPLRDTLAAWLPGAKEATEASKYVPGLKQAEEWLKTATAEIRDQRFEPIASGAQEIWEMLRVQSNVSLGKIELKGTGSQRRVALDVTVDGTDGSALGVMSQGELNSLALAVFLPRAMLPESPFRFIVIDDPVQSMDPSRVDGLARVLDSCARERQVIVFTHDTRLPEAVLRLGYPATIIEVLRREGSVVEPRTSVDPISRYLQDAFALTKTEDLPSKVALRVVPGLCRMALEAACGEAFRRRRLARGERHQDVEELLESADTLNKKAALALFDDPSRTSDVGDAIKKLGAPVADAYRVCNKYSHAAEFTGDLLNLVREVEKLATQFRSRP